MAKAGSRADRLWRLIRSMLDPMVWFHGVRLLHFYAYTHVAEVRKATIGRGVRIAPNVSIANGERVRIDDGAHISAHVSLWAGDSTGRIHVGPNCLIAPDVYVTASNYSMAPGRLMEDQPRIEADVNIGADVWLGRGVVVLPGVTIGDGCVVGASSVVSRDLPPNSIAVGIPAKVVKSRDDGA